MTTDSIPWTKSTLIQILHLPSPLFDFSLNSSVLCELEQMHKFQHKAYFPVTCQELANETCCNHKVPQVPHLEMLKGKTKEQAKVPHLEMLKGKTKKGKLRDLTQQVLGFLRRGTQTDGGCLSQGVGELVALFTKDAALHLWELHILYRRIFSTCKQPLGIQYVWTGSFDAGNASYNYLMNEPKLYYSRE